MVKGRAGGGCSRALLIAALTVAAGAGPTTGPAATQPSLPAGSPRAAMLAYETAAEARDTAGVRDLIYFGPGEHVDLATAEASSVVAKVDYVRAVEKRFGSQTADGRPVRPLSETLRSANETITGDVAKVGMPDGQVAKLVRVDGRWLVDCSEAGRLTIAFRIQMAEAFSAAYAQASADVADGKFATAKDAKTAFSRRFGEAMREARRRVGP